MCVRHTINCKLPDVLIQNRTLLEPIPTAQRLYQYLNVTVRISRMAKTMAVLKGHSGQRVMIVDVELHNKRGEELYAVLSSRPKSWEMYSLQTAAELNNGLGIDCESLPRGMRASSPHFEEYRFMMNNLKGLKDLFLADDKGQKVGRYTHLKCLQTRKCQKKNNKPMLTVKLSSFHEDVLRALRDEHVDLIPIVSIVPGSNKGKKHEKDFSVDYLLPVQVQGQWVGVLYRDGVCKMTLLDRYDIINKAILCDPSFDANSMEWFTNSCERLRVLTDREWAAQSPAVSMESKPKSDDLWARPQSPTASLSSSADSVVASSLYYSPMYPVPVMPIYLGAPPMMTGGCTSMQPVAVNMPTGQMLQFTVQLIESTRQNVEYYGHYRNMKI